MDFSPGDAPGLRVFGPVIIEDNCLIGSGAMILPNVRIGKNAIVATGSVVVADVPPNSIVMGVPARCFGSVEKYKEKCVERWKRQKPLGLHPDAVTNHETSTYQKVILAQLKEHLLNHFQAELR